MQEQKTFSEKSEFERLSEGLVDDTESSLGDLTELLSGHKSPNEYAQDEFDFTDLPIELRDQIVSSIPEKEKNETTAALVASCKKFYNTFQPERLITKFLQAVVDDDREAIKEILDVNPQLLLIDPPANLVIKSKLTHQQFYAENPLKMAANLKQLEMVKILLPYYNNLVSSNKLEQCVIEDALNAWKPYAMQKNADGKDEIIIPKEYLDFAKSLLEVFTKETFPNGAPERGVTPMNVCLSSDTESALLSLLNILVPKNPVELDNHIDVELLLLATLKTYLDCIDSFSNWKQRSSFCIRVIGLIQSALSPETGKIWSHGLSKVIGYIYRGEEIKIFSRGNAFILYGSKYRLYRDLRNERSGCGFDFRADMHSNPRGFAGERLTKKPVCQHKHWKKYVKYKQNKLSEITQTDTHGKTNTLQNASHLTM